jgi:hypothetical protein
MLLNRPSDNRALGILMILTVFSIVHSLSARAEPTTHAKVGTAAYIIDFSG